MLGSTFFTSERKSIHHGWLRNCQTTTRYFALLRQRQHAYAEAVRPAGNTLQFRPPGTSAFACTRLCLLQVLCPSRTVTAYVMAPRTPLILTPPLLVPIAGAVPITHSHSLRQSPRRWRTTTAAAAMGASLQQRRRWQWPLQRIHPKPRGRRPEPEQRRQLAQRQRQQRCKQRGVVRGWRPVRCIHTG